MAAETDTAALQARIAALEAENDALRTETPRRRRVRGRSILAGVLLVVAILLAPIAVLGTWARVQLVDTDRFVATFAPLAEDPQVQSYIADQAMTAIDENLDIQGIVDDLADGLTQLDLPPRAENAIQLLTVPAAQGIRTLVGNAVDRVVASDAFAGIWQTTLRETHSRAVAIIQGQEGTAITLGGDGTLSIDLGVVIGNVKDHLVDSGFGFAEAIPEIQRTIPLATADSFVLIRTLYQVATAAGYWLPWVVLGLLVVGVALAVKRSRAVVAAGAGLTIAFLALLAGFGIGRQFFIGAVSPSVMPAGTAAVVFDQVTELMNATLVALTVLALLIALGAWLSGPWRPARRIRRIGQDAENTLRRTAERYGLSTGSFGAFLDRAAPALRVIVVLGAVAILFLSRPITIGGVLWTLVGVIVLLLLIEVLRRPADEPETATDAAPDAEAAATVSRPPA
ncbi:hypothetical protein [Microbacterium sp. CIAB417]|uniref:hypothetical protein n=1 Tax=Microbacterium sp. CIAB417 TaxID=2860287 RepID=UPI001FADB053|nr:hypothetical protein [Microbacterium sp. CIAB417]